MKISIVIALILLVNFSFAQQTDCFFRNERIDSTNINKIINSLDTICFGYSFSQSEYFDLLDCLFSIDSINPKLRYYQAANCIYKAADCKVKLNDTSYFRHYRYCIEKDYEKARCYYNIGAGYMNFIPPRIENDLSKANKLTEADKLRLMDLAERNFWLSYSSGLKEAIFIVGDIQKMKNEYLKIPLPNINIRQDSLKIIADIRDCGEFGGHIETIDIVHGGRNNYIATFHSDSIFCQEEKARLSENSKYKGKQAGVSKRNLSVLINALDSFKKISLISNAPFRIAIQHNKDVLYQRIDSQYWTYYKDFRMKTFGF